MKLFYAGTCGLALTLFGWANVSSFAEDDRKPIVPQKICEDRGGIVKLTIRPPGQKSRAKCKDGTEIVFDLAENKETP